jgi:capsular exopolysaccharide synthesis family protein
MINTKKIIENEIQVLQSRTIMDKVVKELGLYAPVFQEGKLRTISAYNIFPIKIIAYNPDDIIPVKKAFISYNAKNDLVSFNGKVVGKTKQWINTRYGKLMFVQNEHYRRSESTKPYYFTLIEPKNVTKNILKSLQIMSSNKLSSIIDLSYRDEVPERAEDILNHLISMYDRAAIEEKNSMAKTTLDFVNERLSKVSNDLDSIEKSVQSYKSSVGASDVSTQGQLYLQNVSANDQELGKLNMQLAVLDQVDNAISSNTGQSGGLSPSTIGIEDKSLSQMMADLNTKELEYEKLRKTVAENNPILVSLRDQINKIKPSISENLQNQRKNIEASRNNLLSTNNKYNSMLSSMPQKEKEILEMSRDQNVKSGIYSFLLQKKEESELSYASTLSDSRVINAAQSSSLPVSPNKMLILLGAIAAAIVIGLITITAQEGLTPNVLYRKDLESMTSVPVIGEVAFNDTKESIVIQKGKRSFIAEEFRKIRVSLHFLGIDSTKKKILITSSIPGEGKSFISANLAISNALAGKRVALVDIDLHNPGLGKTFGKSTEDIGVSEFLLGKKNIQEIIHPVKEVDNLSFISSGTLHESPSELLLNGKIKELVDYLEANFDLVVLDTAPSVLITDAFILTDLCDATLYVVRHKYTPKMLVKRIDENLEVNPLHNPAIIFNGVKKRGFFKNNYGYGYDYVYGGKYIEQGKKRNLKIFNQNTLNLNFCLLNLSSV